MNDQFLANAKAYEARQLTPYIERKWAEVIKERDTLALAKIRSDANAILHAVKQHRKRYGTDSQVYVTRIETLAMQIVKEVEATNE